MALFGPFQLLSKAVAVMAEMKVSPQEGMANAQGKKVFAVERRGRLEDSVYFPGLCGVQSLPLIFVPSLGSATSGRRRKSLCASGLRSLELNAQAIRVDSCTSCKSAHMDDSITRTGRNG